MTVRDYEIFSNANMRLIPFFTALSQKWGAEYALAQGSDNAGLFWNKNLFHVWGRAMSEGMLHYGFFPNSGHAQDYLLEADAQLKLTGAIHMRDIMDSNAEKFILEARGATALIDVYENHMVKLKMYEGWMASGAYYEAFNGMQKPDWVASNAKDIFWLGFNERFEELTGSPRGRDVRLDSPPVIEYLRTLPSTPKGISLPLHKGAMCRDIFIQAS